MGDAELTVGERIAVYRRLRGLTQEGLALRLHRSASWVTKVERGVRRVDSMSVLLELSRALSVSLEQLIADSGAAGVDPAGMDNRAALRRVFDRIPSLHGACLVVPAATLTAEAAALRTAYNAGRGFSAAIAALPDLIASAQRTAAVTAGAERASAHAALANLARLASLEFRQHGDLVRARLAIDRALFAAEQADDVLLVASIAATMTIQLMMQGDPEDGVALALDAVSMARLVAAQHSDALVVRGALYLYAAQAAARACDPAEAQRLSTAATGIAERLSGDSERYCLIFGPTNVAIQRAGIMVDLGRPHEAIALAAPVQAERLGSSNRACFHHLHLARAYSMLGDDDAALETVTCAHRWAPDLTRNDPLARGLVIGMLRRRRCVGERLRRLATHMQIMEHG